MVVVISAAGVLVANRKLVNWTDVAIGVLSVAVAGELINNYE